MNTNMITNYLKRYILPSHTGRGWGVGLLLILLVSACQDKDIEREAMKLQAPDASQITGQLDGDDYTWTWPAQNGAQMQVTTYRNGTVSFVDLLLGAASFDEFAKNWDLLNRLNTTDANLSAQAKQLRAEAEQKKAEYTDQAAVAEQKSNDACKAYKESEELVRENRIPPVLQYVVVLPLEEHPHIHAENVGQIDRPAHAALVGAYDHQVIAVDL